MKDHVLKLLVDVPVEPKALAALRRSGRFDVDCMEPPEERVRDVDPSRLRGVDALFCTFPPSNLGDLDAVRWVQIASVGYAQLFGLDLAGRGIRATNARGCFDVPIGEWCVAMMVNLARDLRQMIRNQETATWDRSAIFQREVRGATVGLWGYGGIGRETARLAKHMGMNVHVMTRSGAVEPRRDVFTVEGTGDPGGVLPDRIFGNGAEMEFLGGLDFLVLAVPLTKTTEGMIGERELRALPRSAYLLNPARGPIVEQEALLRALREGWIAGAALDAHYQYPTPPDHPTWAVPNVVFTPHIAGSTLSPRYRTRLWDVFAANADRFARGEPLLNELTPQQLAGA